MAEIKKTEFDRSILWHLLCQAIESSAEERRAGLQGRTASDE